MRKKQTETEGMVASCGICKYEWVPKKATKPKSCPYCKDYRKVSLRPAKLEEISLLR